MVRGGVQVADWRRWQSAMTSPIGDVGSERVNNNFVLSAPNKCETLVIMIWTCCNYII